VTIRGAAVAARDVAVVADLAAVEDAVTAARLRARLAAGSGGVHGSRGRCARVPAPPLRSGRLFWAWIEDRSLTDDARALAQLEPPAGEVNEATRERFRVRVAELVRDKDRIGEDISIDVEGHAKGFVERPFLLW